VLPARKAVLLYRRLFLSGRQANFFFIGLWHIFGIGLGRVVRLGRLVGMAGHFWLLCKRVQHPVSKRHTLICCDASIGA